MPEITPLPALTLTSDLICSDGDNLNGARRGQKWTQKKTAHQATILTVSSI
jgi:hypothetical protein